MINQIIVALLLVPGFLLAQWKPITNQEVKAIYERMHAAYPSENYQIEFVREIFLSVGDTAFQKEKGKVCKGSGLNYAVYSKGSTLIQQGDMKVVCYELNQTVYLMNTDTVMVGFDFETQPAKLDDYTFSKMVDGNQLVLKSTGKHPTTIKETELFLEDGLLVKTIVHLTPGNYVQFSQSDETSESPVMVITYSKPQVIVPDQLISTGRYIYQSEGMYHLNGNIQKKYQLVDLRAPKSITTK